MREVFFTLSERLGFTVLSSREEFPDFLLLRGDKVIRAEVEVYASNFYFHKHPEDACDIIICFENDLENEIPLEILELFHFIEIVRGSRENKLVSEFRGVGVEETENVVRALAEGERFGKKDCVNGIVQLIRLKNLKADQRRTGKILHNLRRTSESIFGYEKIKRNSFFWIKTDKETFKTWFKEWFGKEYEEEKGET